MKASHKEMFFYS